MKFDVMKQENLKDVDQKVKYNKDHENWKRTLREVEVEIFRRV